MTGIMVIAEHRKGELRDITFELLNKGSLLAQESELNLTVVLLGHDLNTMTEELKQYANNVLVFEKKEFKTPTSDAYQRVLYPQILSRKPKLVLMGHTSYGVDLAPSLAFELKTPLATDCIDLTFNGDRVTVTRQIYGGKLNVEVILKKAKCYVVTVRPATFEAAGPGYKGEVEIFDLPTSEIVEKKKFIGYEEPPLGEVDISEADIIVSVGRGIRDEKNLGIIQDLARALKGEVGCSRPIVDKDWLPKDRQIGSSGKTVKPKLYLAAGISGSFQHVMGMKGAGLIIAINKDSKAPIYRIADYGIVDDLFKVIPALTQKIQEAT